MSNYKKVSDRIEELTINNPRTPIFLKWINIINDFSRPELLNFSFTFPRF